MKPMLALLDDEAQITPHLCWAARKMSVSSLVRKRARSSFKAKWKAEFWPRHDFSLKASCPVASELSASIPAVRSAVAEELHARRKVRGFLPKDEAWSLNILQSAPASTLASPVNNDC